LYFSNGIRNKLVVQKLDCIINSGLVATLSGSTLRAAYQFKLWYGLSSLVAGLGSRLSSSSSSGLFSNIVDTIVLVLVGLPVGVHHGGLVPLAGEAVLLEVAFLLAISAGRIQVPDGGGGASLIAVVALVVVLLSGVTNDRKLVELLVRQVLPDDLLCSLLLQILLDGVDAVEPFMVILDGLQVSGNFDALGERVLGCLEHLVADAILQTGQEKLMLNEFEGIRDTFSFDAMAAGFLSVKCL
jgi:hypothetical protein